MEQNAQPTPQVGFYHLTRSTLDDALPALLDRTLKAGERAVVCCDSIGMMQSLDKVLWASRHFLWLPHGTEKTGHAERQPIWLTCGDDVPNGARFLFRINGTGSESFTHFSRIFDLFDGRDQACVEQARLRWSRMKEAGYAMTYWKQESKGWRQAG